MADTKLSALTADTSPTSDDLVYTVNDPGGTPASRKVTLANFALRAWAYAVKPYVVEVVDPSVLLVTGDGQGPRFIVPVELNGHNLVTVAAAVNTVSSSGTPTIQIRNVTQTADMLSTRITIDANEKHSSTAAAAAVIDTGNDDVATGDEIAFDIDVAGTGTKGLTVIMGFQLP